MTHHQPPPDGAGDRPIHAIYAAIGAINAGHYERAKDILKEWLAAPARSRPAAEPVDEGELWSLIRRVLGQGHAQQMDYAAGKWDGQGGYEGFSANVDHAARERVPQFIALLRRLSQPAPTSLCSKCEQPLGAHFAPDGGGCASFEPAPTSEPELRVETRYCEHDECMGHRVVYPATPPPPAGSREPAKARDLCVFVPVDAIKRADAETGCGCTDGQVKRGHLTTCWKFDLLAAVDEAERRVDAPLDPATWTQPAAPPAGSREAQPVDDRGRHVCRRCGWNIAACECALGPS